MSPFPWQVTSWRFKEAGYDKPKALLPVGDKLMIEHVIDMFDPEQCIFHIVVNAEQERDHPEIHTLFPAMAPNENYGHRSP